MDDREIYLQSFRYENLIKTAFNCQRGMRNGADLCFMQNAMTMEQGKTYAKHLGSFEKQFQKVKVYTEKALLKLSKTKPFNSEEKYFLKLANIIENIETTSELINVVNLGMEKVIELKKNYKHDL